MSSAATTLLSGAGLSTLTDHLVVDTTLRIPTAKWAQTDDALSLEIKTACIGDTKRIAFQHDVFNTGYDPDGLRLARREQSTFINLIWEQLFSL